EDSRSRFRIAARAHRPDHVLYVRGIDVVVHDDDPAADVSDRGDLRRDQPDLCRVTEVALLDRYDAERSSATGLVQPRASHIGNAGAFERVEQCRGSQETALEQMRVRRLLARRAGQYR